MTKIQIIGRELEVEILGWHKLWSFKDRIQVPLIHVVGAGRLEQGAWLGGLRLPGTYVPGVIRAGSYYRGGKWLFWDVCAMQEAVVIELREEGYSVLVVETFDPDAAVMMIRSAIRDRMR